MNHGSHLHVTFERGFGAGNDAGVVRWRQVLPRHVVRRTRPRGGTG